MKMKILALCAVLFITCSALHFVEPAAAAKMVDHGTKYYTIAHPNDTKFVWKTYQYKKHGKLNNNFIKAIMTVYLKNSKGKYVENYKFITAISKINKSTLKLKDTVIPYGDWGRTDYTYKKTSLTAAQYYWRVYRSQLQPL